MTTPNQNPEQVARDRIDRRLHDAGWKIQSKDGMNVFAALGVAVRELQTTEGPADYTLFVDATTNDPLYHVGAFYQFDLSFEAA